MTVSVVGNDSNGNCYVLGQNDSKIILDMGKSWKEVLKACNYDVLGIEASLITHEHGDHTKYLKDLNAAGISIFGNKAVKKKFPYVKELPTGKSAEIGNGWTAIPFNVPHTHNDGTDCENYAYIIKRNDEILLYLTDWMYCPYKLTKFRINHFLIAVNYTDLEDDGQGGISHVMKGHSSLDTALEFLKVNVTDACRSIIACHMSLRNCDEVKVLEGLENTAPRVRTIALAKKGVTYSV